MEIQWHAAKVPSLANQHRAEIEQIGNGDARNVEFRGEVRRDDSGWEAPDFSSSVARPEIWPGVGSRFIPTGAAGLHRAGLKVENLRAESLRAEDLKPENRAAFTNGAKGAVA